MGYKWLGAILVLLGCGSFGFSMAVSFRKEEKILKQLIYVLENMESELQYRLTPLPELCRQAGADSSGTLQMVFLNLYRELSCQMEPDVSSCMSSALRKSGELPKQVRKHLYYLGKSLGRFDLTGQIRGIKAIENACRDDLKQLNANKDVRLRSYQTLSLCAGAALVILFI